MLYENKGEEFIARNHFKKVGLIKKVYDTNVN